MPRHAVGLVLALLLLIARESAQKQDQNQDDSLFAWQTSSKQSLQPGKGLLDWFAFGPLVFNNTVVSRRQRKVTTFTSVPFKATLPPSEVGTLDHLKFLAFTNKTFTAPSGGAEKLVYTLEATVKVTLPKVLQKPSPQVSKPKDDIRLGSCAAVFADFTTMMVSDIFVTNQGVWAFYERLPFARSATNNYAAFSYAKRVADYKPGRVLTLQFVYDRSAHTMRWVVNGKQVLKINQLGLKPPASKKLIPLVDLGGTEQEVVPASFNAGFGCFTLLDFADPNNPRNPASGLLKLNPPPVEYKLPTAFASTSNDASVRLQGQGASMSIKRMTVQTRRK